MEADQRITIDRLARQHSISTGSVHSILHKDLQKTKKTAKFVPRLLTDEQRATRVRVCKSNLQEFERNPAMIRHIITGDESSFSTYQPESKESSRQWMTKGKAAGRPKKALRCTTKKSTMLICFFDIDGLVHHEFVPPKTKVTSDFYCQVLACLRERIRKARPHFWPNSSFKILHDNASVHTAHHTVTRMMETDMTEIEHPPYSPDLAPCNFWMFPAIKKQLKGQQFRTIPQLQAAVVAALQGFDKEDYIVAFDRLLTRWRKCIAADGHYFEGDNVNPNDAQIDSESEEEQ